MVIWGRRREQKNTSNILEILSFSIHLALPYFSHSMSIAMEVSKEAVINLREICKITA